MAEEEENVFSAYKKEEGMPKTAKNFTRPPPPGVPLKSRYELLSIPKRTQVISTYKNYINRFDERHKRAVSRLVDYLVGLPALEAEKFMGGFRMAREKSLTYAQRKRKLAQMQKRRLQRTLEDDIFRAFQKLVEKLILYTYQHPYPNLRPVRVDNYSEFILRSIFHIIPFPRYQIPDNIREDVCNDTSVILLRCSDWLAVWLDELHAAVKGRLQYAKRINDEDMFDKSRIEPLMNDKAKRISIAPIPDNFDDFNKNLTAVSSGLQLKSTAGTGTYSKDKKQPEKQPKNETKAKKISTLPDDYDDFLKNVPGGAPSK